MESELARGSWIDPSAGQLTFGELADRWLRSNPAKRSSTWARDDAILRNHLRPVLGKVSIASVSKAIVQQLVNELAIYAQATTEADRDAAEKLGERFFGAVRSHRSQCRQVPEPRPRSVVQVPESMCRPPGGPSHLALSCRSRTDRPRRRRTRRSPATRRGRDQVL